MITTITSKYQNQYQELFEQAYADLAKAGKLPEDFLRDEEGKIIYDENGKPTVVAGSTISEITSLEQYFYCLGDLYQIDKKYVFLLPLDEPTFNIDANARVIEVPASFKKNGIAVQGDVIAETLMFKINRFFDGVDLNDTNIWVQWKKADGSDGVSKVDFKYIDRDPEELLFAWPITGRITDLPGALNFAVRFEKRDGEQIFYSLNTIAANVNINKALKADMVYEDIDSASALFENAITNSQEISEGQNIDVSVPVFAAPGVAAPAAGAVDLVDNTLRLKVQAIVEDTGAINYTWTKPQNAGASKDVYEETIDTVRVEGVRYYIPSADGQAYTLYTGELADLPTGVKAFERYSIFEITDGTEPVLGTYSVKANNRKGWGSAESEPLSWTISGPTTLTIDPIAETLVLTENVDKITAKTNTDVGNNVSYKWLYTNDIESDLWVEESATAADITIEDKIGWYKVKAIAERNRATIEETSNVCKVTNFPVAPVLVHAIDAEDEVVAFDGANFVTISADYTNTEYANPLYSDKVTFTWYEESNVDLIKINKGVVEFYSLDAEGNESIANPILITAEAYPKFEVVNAQTLVIPNEDLYKGAYQCLVVNELNGEKAYSMSGRFIVA